MRLKNFSDEKFLKSKAKAVSRNPKKEIFINSNNCKITTLWREK